MTEDEINSLLEAQGIKPASLWGTRTETKLEILKGTKYVDRNGTVTRYGRLELDKRRKAASKRTTGV